MSSTVDLDKLMATLPDDTYEDSRNGIPRPRRNVSDERYSDWSLGAILRNRESFEALRFDGKSVDEIIREL